jgi:hypothetical protein
VFQKERKKQREKEKEKERDSWITVDGVRSRQQQQASIGI